MSALAWLVPILPFAAFAVIGPFTRGNRGLSALLSIGAVLLGALISYGILFELLGGARASNVEIPWASLGEHELTIGWQVDSLTATMLVVVTTISLLVQVYSWGYMHHQEQHDGHLVSHPDPGLGRFYAYLSLFTAAMLGLVLGNNLLTVYIFWEGVGLGSYLLIGFWYDRPSATGEGAERDPNIPLIDERPSPSMAAKKAFLTTRLGDFGMLVGILIFWFTAGTLQFSELAEKAHHGDIPAGWLALGAILLFTGAIGKSAQFPLHVWLPDAMEGPTPVSALIHAATMVAAGVYLVARAFPLYEASPTASYFVAGIGGFTCIFAASMGLVSFDLKRVMAYSTVSQLGYMMLGLGAGSLVAGVFHLFTHAFFKALLFLTAGSVIHGTEDTQDIRKLGGLRQYMPITFVTMLIGAISLAGIVPFSGFWSKDMILGAVFSRAARPDGSGFLFYGAFALITVFMTAFYMFRVIFTVFFGQEKYPGHHAPHESPGVMAWPLIVLAVPSVLVGLWGSPLGGDGFGRFLEGADFHEEMNTTLAVGSTVVALAGIGLAYAMYLAQAISPARIAAAFGPLYRLPLNKYYLDDLYQWFIGKVVLGLSALLAWVVDPMIIDGVVNGIGRLAVAVSTALRPIQSGRVQSYALFVFGGLALISLVAMFALRP